MNNPTDRFPLILEVCLEIAYDNNLADDSEAEDKYLEKCNEILGADGITEEDLHRLELWLSTLPKEDLVTIAAGEGKAMEEILRTAPTGGPYGTSMADIFNDIFDNAGTLTVKHPSLIITLIP